MTFTQSGNGAIFGPNGRPLVEASPTWVLANDLLRRAESLARVTGSLGANYTETVLGVAVRVEWTR